MLTSDRGSGLQGDRFGNADTDRWYLPNLDNRYREKSEMMLSLQCS